MAFDALVESCCSMKGFLNFIILRLISKKAMSGQTIRAEIGKRKGCAPSAGTIYPVLKFLKENALIEEKTKGGKEKKYTITERGKKELAISTKKFVALFCDMGEEFR
jgi:DNA-binding PadR family transcriptional regulator